MLRKMWSEMNYGLRLLILIGFGGIATASVALHSRYRALQTTVTSSQAQPETRTKPFEMSELHSDPKLDLALHQLRNSPTLDNLVDCYAMLTERANDPQNPYDVFAWSWFISSVGKQAINDQTDNTLWEWFKSDVISDQNPIYAQATVRESAISVLRQQDEEVPSWMIRNPDDRRIAMRPPLPNDYLEKTALTGASEDAETKPGDDQ